MYTRQGKGAKTGLLEERKNPGWQPDLNALEDTEYRLLMTPLQSGEKTPITNTGNAAKDSSKPVNAEDLMKGSEKLER